MGKEIVHIPDSPHAKRREVQTYMKLYEQAKPTVQKMPEAFKELLIDEVIAAPDTLAEILAQGKIIDEELAARNMIARYGESLLKKYDRVQKEKGTYGEEKTPDEITLSLKALLVERKTRVEITKHRRDHQEDILTIETDEVLTKLCAALVRKDPPQAIEPQRGDITTIAISSVVRLPAEQGAEPGKVDLKKRQYKNIL